MPDRVRRCVGEQFSHSLAFVGPRCRGRCVCGDSIIEMLVWVCVVCVRKSSSAALLGA